MACMMAIFSQIKIDLSGYFMSIDRKQVSDKFRNLIVEKYKGKHKELLLYLTPVIFENNPAVKWQLVHVLFIC